MEAEFLTSDDPQRMLAWLTDAGRATGTGLRVSPPVPSDHKLRLFACACHRSQTLGGVGPESSIPLLEDAADDPAKRVPGYWRDYFANPTRWATRYFASYDCSQSSIQAALLREIVGNPFRPLSLTRPEEDVPPLIRQLHPQHWPKVRWLTPTALAVARRAYDERDWEALPVLADALEDSGCAEQEILRHLRGQERCPSCLGDGGIEPGAMIDCPACEGEGRIPLRAPHVRGCWAVDLILSKE